MMDTKYSKIHFFSEEDSFQFYSKYCDGYEDIGRAQGAALQYFMSQFMYLPNTLIAEILGRKPWHVNQTIQRLVEAAEDTRIPVTMNDAYRDYLEDLDDFLRDTFGCKNPELCMVTDYKTRAWILWSAQKASGWYEDSDLEPDQVEMVDELLKTIGLPPGGWMADIISENFKIDYHD
jgi:hypothetical protein